jgi:hypothetical protein
MSMVWEVPVVAPAEPVEALTRRMLQRVPDAMPRDMRPSRARRERLPEPLRVWGATRRSSSGEAAYRDPEP